ncbi:MAG: heme-binding domain-containing protein [Oligoflexales bacterium]
MEKLLRLNNTYSHNLQKLVIHIIQALFIVAPTLAFSVGHSSLPKKPASAFVEGIHNVPSYSVISSLEKDYIHEIEPIFSRKCFGCHTPNHKIKWYFKMPVINKLINRNFKRALKALDLSVGFPFIGTKSILKSLLDLDQSICQGSMPPPWWTIIFWQAGLSKAERNLIHHWVQDGLKQIKLDR